MVAVVVGASVAGARALQSLRRLGYPGRIILIGEETAAPYDRPPLSKAMLSGRVTAERFERYARRAKLIAVGRIDIAVPEVSAENKQ